ncbi:MAG: hypothetical protein QXQ48_06440 [Nitrososphaerota archaeon]
MRALFIAAVIAAVILAYVPIPVAGQQCIRSLATGDTVEGELRGPEDSGETHIYCLAAEKGDWLSVTVEMYHKERLSSRIITGLTVEGGGFLLYRDEVLPTGGSKTYSYNWYVSGSEGNFRLVLTSVANRLAPSVVGYRVSVSISREVDADIVQLKSGAGTETIRLDIGDAPSELYGTETLPELPGLTPGQSLTLTGHLSASISRETDLGAELYGGRDTSDMYLIPVNAPANSRLNITVTPPRGVSIQVVLRSEDGAALVSSSSRKPGEPAQISTSFSKAVKDEKLILDIQLLRSELPIVAYRVDVMISEPPRQETQIEFKPPFPESQARIIVIGFSATVIAATIASVIIGWFRRKPERQQPYYW